MINFQPIFVIFIQVGVSFQTIAVKHIIPTTDPRQLLCAICCVAPRALFPTLDSVVSAAPAG